MNVEICVPTTRATLFDQGAASYCETSLVSYSKEQHKVAKAYHNNTTDEAWDIRYSTRIPDTQIRTIKDCGGDQD